MVSPALTAACSSNIPPGDSNFGQREDDIQPAVGSSIHQKPGQCDGEAIEKGTLVEIERLLHFLWVEIIILSGQGCPQNFRIQQITRLGVKANGLCTNDQIITNHFTQFRQNIAQIVAGLLVVAFTPKQMRQQIACIATPSNGQIDKKRKRFTCRTRLPLLSLVIVGAPKHVIRSSCCIILFLVDFSAFTPRFSHAY